MNCFQNNPFLSPFSYSHGGYYPILSPNVSFYFNFNININNNIYFKEQYNFGNNYGNNYKGVTDNINDININNKKNIINKDKI